VRVPFCCAGLLLVSVGLAQVGQYHSPIESTVSLDPMEQEILDWINTVRAGRGVPPLTVEGGYVQVLRRYSALLANQRTAEAVNKDILRALFWQQGLSDYKIVPTSLMAEGSTKRLLIQLKSMLVHAFDQRLLDPQYNVAAFGIKLREDDLKGAFSLMERKTVLAPFPAQVEAGRSYHLEGTFGPGYGGPILYVTSPLGTVVKLDGKHRGEQFFFDFTFPRETGRYSLEVLVRGTKGPTVANLFPVFQGVDPDYGKENAELEVDEDFDCDPTVCERTLLGWVNTYRAQYKLSLLERDAKMDLIARGHSIDMQRNKFFGHQSPTTGNVGDRTKAQGVAFLKVTENLGKDTSLGKGFLGLLESPGHRMNLLDREVSRIGVGVAGGKGQLKFLTLNFLLPGKGGAPGEVLSAFSSKLESLRRSSGVPALKRDDRLEEVAREHSGFMLAEASVSSQLKTHPPLTDRLRQRTLRVRKLSVLVGKTKTPESMLTSEKLKSAEFDTLGLGVVEDPAEKGMYWVTMILAKL